MMILNQEERFQYAVDIVLEHEGGLSNDKRDPGGITKWGISLRYLRAIGLDVDKDGDIDAHDIIAIDKPYAKHIYREYWWDLYLYERIQDLQIATKTFDLAINMGARPAHRVLQRAINRMIDKPIAVDGLLGIQTVTNCNQLKGEKLHEKMRKCAKERYMEIIEHNPKLHVFQNGWLNRAAW